MFIYFYFFIFLFWKQLKSQESDLISKLQDIESEREKIAEETKEQKKELEKLEVEEERYACSPASTGCPRNNLYPPW